MYAGFSSPAAGTTVPFLLAAHKWGNSRKTTVSLIHLIRGNFPCFPSKLDIPPIDSPQSPHATTHGGEMASITKYKSGYRAQLYIKGVRKSKTFRTMREAQGWAGPTETALKQAPAERHTVRDLIERYRRDTISKKKGATHEDHQAVAFLRDFPDLAAKKLSELDTPDFVAWRDTRLLKVKGSTLIRNLNWLRHAFRLARDEWKWMAHNPLKSMGIPRNAGARDRRVSPQEVRMLCRNLGYRSGRAPETKQQEVALAFMVALRSAMRAGEILSLGRGNLNFSRRVATVEHKMQHLTGKPREVPLSPAAIRLLMPVADREQCFTISSAVLDTMFRKARDRVMIEDLHFHDTRGEALTRLAKKVHILMLARISGHKDVRMLQIYYRETADQIAAQL